MLRIGITGCIGSGKTTVARIFEVLGVPVYNADVRAKAVMTEDISLINWIKSRFGVEAYDNAGNLNRAYLASKVFHDQQALADLNALVHPAVFKDFDDWCEAHNTSTYIVKEAALMFESDSYKHLHEVITVTAPENIRIMRTIQRDNISEEEVRARMKNQMSEEEKKSRSQHIIMNDEVNAVIPQVLAFHQNFMNR